MALKGFRKPPQSTPETQTLSNATADFTRQLENNPLLDGRILSQVVIGTTATAISHLLNRNWVGWFIVSKTSAADIYEGTQTLRSQYLTLIASSSTTVDIYVF